MKLEAATTEQKEAIKQLITLNTENLVPDIDLEQGTNMILSDDVSDSLNAVEWVTNFYNSTRKT